MSTPTPDPWPTLARARGWFECGPMRIYLRKTQHYLGGAVVPTLDVGSVEVEESCRGQGIFTTYLELIEAGERTVFVESVLNARLQEFLRKRGYTEVPNSSGSCPSFYLTP